MARITAHRPILKLDVLEKESEGFLDERFVASGRDGESVGRHRVSVVSRAEHLSESYNAAILAFGVGGLLNTPFTVLYSLAPP
jgi:hypothetical protein